MPSFDDSLPPEPQRAALADTHAKPTLKGEAAQLTQRTQSFGTMLGTILDTPQGRYFGSMVFAGLFGCFMFACGYLAAMQGATVTNRCLGLAILSKIDPTAWNLPDWCEPRMKELRAPPPRVEP